MEINTGKPVNGQVQGLETAPKVSEVKREKEEAPGQQTAQAEGNPDYKVSLSDESRQAVAELASSQASAQNAGKPELSDEAAAQLARQASGQLSQTNAAISNQAIQKAVDLFT